MRALCLLREAVAYRREAYCAGLEAAGYEVCRAIGMPRRDDVLVSWNRYGAAHDAARQFELAGARVVVTENGHLGKAWRDGAWYALALGHHAGAGTWPYGGVQRWDAWNVELGTWRESGDEVVIFAQRGIGEPAFRSPASWADRALERLLRRHPRMKARVRAHPGNHAPAVPLVEDLAHARAVVTWHSAAATAALLHGVPVFYDCPAWIGAAAGRPFADLLDGAEPRRDDAARLEVFRRLAWAMWSIDEIASGVAFRHLLQHEGVAA